MTTYITDIEANSLDPDKIWVICMKEFQKSTGLIFIHDDYWNDSGVVSLCSSYERKPLSAFKDFIRNRPLSGRLVGHNFIDFDMYALRKVLSVDVKQLGWEIRDTYVLSRLTDVMRSGGHSVEAWGERFGLEKVAIDDEQWAKFEPVMITRCIRDCEIQDKVYDHLRRIELKGFSLETIELEQNVQELMSQQRRDGVYIDVPMVHGLFMETKVRADEIQREIQQVFKPKPVLLREYIPKVLKNGNISTRNLGGVEAPDGPFSSILFEYFNLDSPKQRVDRLLGLGWKPTKFTKPSKTHPKGQPQFDEDALDDLPEDAPEEIKLLGTYLMLRSKQRTFNQWLDGVDKYGLLHGSVNILGARTHRMSHTDPNLGNIAAVDYDKETKVVLKGIQGRFGWESRSCFTVEDLERNLFVDADAEGIQLRAVAHYSGSSEYISLISDPKYDPHQTHADALGCSRAVAKTFIYAWILGAGIRKIASILGCSVDEAKERMEAFYLRFPFLLEVKEMALTWGRKGYMIALDGRPIKITDDYKALAYFLQSFERIVMGKAMVEYQKELKQQGGLWYKQRLVIHDEFLTETRREYADLVGNTMSKHIVKAGEYFNSKCPLASKFKKGLTWADAH